MNLSSIQEISIIKGGFNAEYGNVRSGMINIVTKDPRQRGYNGSIDFRFTPARLKHSGAPLFDPMNYYLRSYLDPEVAMKGTSMWDEETRSQYPEFEGWEAYAARINSDANPDNDMTPEEAMVAGTDSGRTALITEEEAPAEQAAPAEEQQSS